MNYRALTVATFVLLQFAAFIPASSFAARQDAKAPSELVFIFQKQKDPALIRSQANELGSALSEKLGMPVQTQVPSSYAASVQAFVSGKADVAYVDSLAFILAERDGEAEILLAEKRTDPTGTARTNYDSVFVVRADSPLKTFEDLKQQAHKLHMVFTSPTSTSGYVMPYRRFVKEGVLEQGQDTKEVFQDVSFGGSYVQALEQVLRDRGDVAAVSYYSIEGPAADKYLKKEQRAQLRVLARTPGVPTHVIMVRKTLPDTLKQKIREGLLELSSERSNLLEDVYGASQFTAVDQEQHVAASREALKLLKISADQLVLNK